MIATATISSAIEKPRLPCRRSVDPSIRQFHAPSWSTAERPNPKDGKQGERQTSDEPGLGRCSSFSPNLSELSTTSADTSPAWCSPRSAGVRQTGTRLPDRMCGPLEFLEPSLGRGLTNQGVGVPGEEPVTPKQGHGAGSGEKRTERDRIFAPRDVETEENKCDSTADNDGQ